MHISYFIQKIIHLPRRVARECIMLFKLLRLFLLNRFGRASITHPDGPVVSLTTHGKRLETSYLAIESIARGLTLPSRLILWIDDVAQFTHLPASIQRLQHRGLDVQLCRDFGPHKKYYPYVESCSTFDLPLVTADDDILYPRYWLNCLIKAYREYPDVVNCYGAHVIPMSPSGIEQYRNWSLARCTSSSYCHIAMGGLGTIYPCRFLTVLKSAGNAFLICCPKGDDLWLHVQAIRAGLKVRQILPQIPYLSFQMIPLTQRSALSRNNVDRDGNELQIKATYTAQDLRILLDACASDTAPF